jgi:hypothetical protein
MSTLRKAAAVAAVFGSVLLLPAATEAQDAATPSAPRLISRPVVPTLRPALSSLQRSGTVTVKILATIGSNIPPIIPVSCEGELFVFDPAFFDETFVSGFVTRSGTTGTCTFVIPYTFQVSSAATNLTVVAAIGTVGNTPFYLAQVARAFPIPNGNSNLTVNLGI